jgi:hypothetical protein
MVTEGRLAQEQEEWQYSQRVPVDVSADMKESDPVGIARLLYPNVID